MKNEIIDGLGSISGGEYNEIKLDGIGKLKKPLSATKISIDGLFKSKAPITTNEMTIDGIARVFKDMKAKKVYVNGILKMRNCKLYTEFLESDGIIVCNKEISADTININGLCSVTAIYGDIVSIKTKEEVDQKSNIPSFTQPFVKMYFGRKLNTKSSEVDTVECTHFEGHNIKCKVVRANSIKLTGNSIINTLHCDGKIELSSSCVIGKVIGKGEIDKKESISMANLTLTKILNMYKDGKINADEAEKMLQSSVMVNNADDPDVSWDDDGKLRIVAYIGRKILKKSNAGSDKITVNYEGKALNVECACNISCGNVDGNIKAGGSVHCGDIGGNVACGGSVHCGSVNGSVASPGGVHLVK